MFYGCFVTLNWLKYEFSAINLLGSAFLKLGAKTGVTRTMLVSLFADGSLDGVTGAFVMSSSITCFVWHWPLISFHVFFSYIVRIIYDGLLTLSKYLFLIVCWVLVRQKYQYMACLRFMHPRTPRTSARSDELSRLSWLFMVALSNRETIYIFILFLSFFFFPRLISAVGGWMSTILRHMVWS